MDRTVVSATDAKQTLGRLLEAVERASIQIQRNGRTVAYLDEANRHERLERVAASETGRRLVAADRYRTGEISRDEAMLAIRAATVEELVVWVAALGLGLPRLDDARSNQLADAFLLSLRD
jgi:antitoxin (DNA-binding transcriptional repressor) of toxin-antitoxin stability system